MVNSAHGKSCVTKRAALTAGLVAAVVCFGTRGNKRGAIGAPYALLSQNAAAFKGVLFSHLQHQA